MFYNICTLFQGSCLSLHRATKLFKILLDFSVQRLAEKYRLTEHTLDAVGSIICLFFM